MPPRPPWMTSCSLFSQASSLAGVKPFIPLRLTHFFITLCGWRFLSFHSGSISWSHGLRSGQGARVKNMQTRHLFQQWGPFWYEEILNADIWNICITTYCATYLSSTLETFYMQKKVFKKLTKAIVLFPFIHITKSLFTQIYSFLKYRVASQPFLSSNLTME